MKLIKSKACLIEQAPGLNGIYKQIELAGRTKYQYYEKYKRNKKVCGMWKYL